MANITTRWRSKEFDSSWDKCMTNLQAQQTCVMGIDIKSFLQLVPEASKCRIRAVHMQGSPDGWKIYLELSAWKDIHLEVHLAEGHCGLPWCSLLPLPECTLICHSLVSQQFWHEIVWVCKESLLVFPFLYRGFLPGIGWSNCLWSWLIPLEILKWLPDDWIIQLTFIMNSVFLGIYPASWSFVQMFTIHIGHCHTRNSYRGISVANMLTKLYDRILNNRLYPGTTQLLMFRLYIDIARKPKLTLYLIFIDYKNEGVWYARFK